MTTPSQWLAELPAPIQVVVFGAEVPTADTESGERVGAAFEQAAAGLARAAERLDAEIAATKALAHKPFGVNLITMHPDLMALIDVCVGHGVGHVVLAGGLPPGGAIDRIKAGGAKVSIAKADTGAAATTN